MHGQMKLRHNSGNLSHSIDCLGQEVLRMRRGKENTLDPGVPNSAQKLREARLAEQVTSIGVNVLSQQGDLTHAHTRERGHLIDDLLKRTALLSSAHVGNDAIGAKVIASRHDGDPGVIRIRTMPWHIRSR